MKAALITEKQIKEIEDALEEIKASGLLKEQPWSNWVQAIAIVRSLKDNNSFEKLETDAKCFRFWVQEAEHNPVNMAKLIMYCRTEQDYRDAIIPVLKEAERTIIKALGETK